MLFGLLVNDSVAAAIIGASFTACLGLIAWIVVTMGKMTTRIEVLATRLDILESTRNGQHAARGHD